MIKNRKEFKQYILEQLGEPVSKVNVTDSQLEACVDDALIFWQNYYFDGSMRMFLKQIVTPSTLKITTTDLSKVTSGALIKGSTSHATARVCPGGFHDDRTTSTGNCIYCCDILERDFIAGEQIDINGTQYTLVSSPDYQIKGIVDERRIKMPDWILGVVRIIPFSQAMSSQNLFDLQYQIRLNDFQNLTSQSLIYYEQAMEHISLLNFELTANPYFEFNQYDGYVYPNCNWNYDLCIGDYMIFDCFRALDPSTAWKMWNEMYLKKLAVAYTKRQFGQNLRKYNGMQLPGGITFNGTEIYQEAVAEIEKIESEIVALAPVSAFMVG